MNLDIKINCHASICINKDIYIDPLHIKDKTKNAKIIFITHSHWDHLDIDSIKNIYNEKTIFVCPLDCQNLLLQNDIKKENIQVVKPNETLEILKIKCEVIHSYNINKKFHPKNNNWVGYLLTIDNIKYLICGDSDLTEELKNIKTDVLFVPIGGTYTMNAKEGAQLANTIKPKLVIPMHYGEIVGNKEMVKEFLSFLSEKLESEVLI